MYKLTKYYSDKYKYLNIKLQWGKGASVIKVCGQIIIIIIIIIITEPHKRV